MKYKSILMAWICLVSLFGLSPAYAEVTVDDFSLQIELPDGQVKVGDKINIKCSIINVSKNKLNLPFEESLLKIKLNDPDGNELQRVSPRVATDHYMYPEQIALNPGEKYEHTISGEVISATKEVYSKNFNGVEEVQGTFIILDDLYPEIAVYVESSSVNVYAQYDLLGALEASRPIDFEGKNRNKKIENPVLLKSNMVVLNISD